MATILDNSIITIKAKDLTENLLDLEDMNLIPSWSLKTHDAGHPTRIPNPDRKLADGDPLYCSFIDIFGDDVSGNRSKSWNKHWNIYMSHRNLPRTLLSQQFHVHFISTSTHASVPEQYQGVKTYIESVLSQIVLINLINILTQKNPYNTNEGSPRNEWSANLPQASV